MKKQVCCELNRRDAETLRFYGGFGTKRFFDLLRVSAPLR